MLGEQWQLGLLAGWIVINVLFAYRAYRLRTRDVAADSDVSDAASDAAGADLVDDDAGVATCPECGAANELGYRFCRSCVSELPGTMAFERDADGPLGRFVR